MYVLHPQSFCSLRNPRTDSACSFVVRLPILLASCTSTPERNLWQGGLGLLPANQHSELTASSGIKVQPIFRSVRTEILHCFAKRVLACQVSMRGICEKWLQNLFRKYEGRDRLGDLGVDFRIILKWCSIVATLRDRPYAFRIPVGPSDFSVLQNVQTDSGFHRPSCSVGTGVLSSQWSGRCVNWTTQIRRVPRLGGGAVSLLPLYAFIAWTAEAFPFLLS
jgi:hypothetical protein